MCEQLADSFPMIEFTRTTKYYEIIWENSTLLFSNYRFLKLYHDNDNVNDAMEFLKDGESRKIMTSSEIEILGKSKLYFLL